jgi:polyferredoxin
MVFLLMHTLFSLSSVFLFFFSLFCAAFCALSFIFSFFTKVTQKQDTTQEYQKNSCRFSALTQQTIFSLF